MKLKHDTSLSTPTPLVADTATVTLSRVQCLAVSPNLLKLAACFSATNHIVLYDLADNEEKDKFALKSSGKSASGSASSAGAGGARKNFIVTGLCFSLDSEKLAIGQSDCVIYVYRIGQNWKEKKAIVNKFNLTSPVAGLQWMPLGLIFSAIDGRVKFIQTQSNKMFSLVSSPSMAVSLSCFGDQVVAGFQSGAILLNSVHSRESAARQLFVHSCPPVALALTATQYTAVGGSDGRIVFLEVAAGANYEAASSGPGSMLNSAASSNRARSLSSSASSGSSGVQAGGRQTIEWGADLSNAVASPSGTIVIFSSRDNLLLFELESRTWKHKMTVNLSGALLITGLTWSADGTKLVTAALNGSIELFRCRWKSKLLGSRFEVNYIGLRQIVINDLERKYTSMFSAAFDIRDVKIIKANFVIIWTAATLIMASLTEPKARSEIEWHGLTTQGVRFSFDYENVVLISAIGELFLIELGQDKILGSVRTDFVSPHLLSVRINERKSNAKVFAYLLDVKTIAVIDLSTGLQICTWSHSERIDWMELNETGNKLIYRDKALKLVLLNIINQEFLVLLHWCGFVQWVPQSDVVVAQSKEKIYIWYDFTKPVICSVGGGEANEAVEIERAEGKTWVKMTIPGTDVLLDEVLLEFDTAIDDGDLERAETFLESLTESSPNGTADTNSMWLLLGNIALKSLNLSIGERAFAAIGDVAKVAFIKQCQADSSLIALLDNDWQRFEGSGDFDQVLTTYMQTYNWERAIGFARRHGRSELVEEIQSKYYNWLLETGQHSIAAQILEKSGKIEESIALYLKSGRMFAVTKLILNHWNGTNSGGGSTTAISAEMIRRVIEELNRKEAFEEAGDLYQLPPIDNKDAALQSYVKGNAYTKAITLARRSFPDEVVNLENQYGEYLLNETNDPANAVNHFIEAGKTERALEAAITARQFDRASEIASILDHIPPFYGKKIADYYAGKEEIESALEMYLNSGCIRDAVQMLNDKGQYARAYKIAAKMMDSSEAKEMYEYIAKGYESEGKHREAEKIYIACGDVDAAISMYKTAKSYEAMLRLVKQYHPNLLTETSIYLAKELEAERSYKQAETYYVSVQEWKLAALMYKNAELWEDAYRVSRAHGGAVAAKQVAYHWAQTMPSPGDAVALLNRYGLLNQVVDYSLETNSYDFALSLILASGSELKHKLVDVRLKYALWLETEGHYNEAEAMFIEANKPKEAVVMYLHANAFDEALRVAEALVQDDEVVKDVLTAQARYLFERDRAAGGSGTSSSSGHFSTTLNKVESLLLRAGRIEVAIRLYKDVGLWNEAVRVCEQYAPHLIDSLKREMIAEARESSEMYYATAGGGREGEHSARSGRQQETPTSSSTIEPAAPQVDLYQALKVAEQNDDKEAIVRYTILIATQLLKDRLTLDSLKMLQKHDAVFILPDSKKLLSRIAVIILSELEDFTWSGTEPETDSRTAIYAGLRDCFTQLLSINNGLNNIERDLFEKYLLISHYLTIKSILEAIIKDTGAEKNNNFRETYLKITVSLLRYTDVIRADKAFYEAGIAAREANRLEMAFVFLNHFLDLLDAIEEHDYNVDHSDFVGTDIPYEVPLPSKLYYDGDVVEEIKSWILQTSMDTELSQSLPLDPLRDGEVYEASLVNADGTKCLPCLVTGYPVIRHKMIEFKAGKYAANKEDWNKLLMMAKITDNQELKQVLHFIGRLCGNSTIVKFSFQ